MKDGNFEGADLNTILVALRCYQNHGAYHGLREPDLKVIATNAGRDDPLSADAINALYEALNSRSFVERMNAVLPVHSDEEHCAKCLVSLTPGDVRLTVSSQEGARWLGVKPGDVVCASCYGT
ncbi:MAG: hypothetical protein WDO24_05715 [Pseudomonadota bacterium]